MLLAAFAMVVAAFSGPQEYLYETYPDMAPTLDCVVWYESRWQSDAISPGGTYVGLAQFDRDTWAATPQGQAGLSRYDPYASIDALVWGWVHLGKHRWPVSSRLC
jgi:hypothetical protein